MKKPQLVIAAICFIAVFSCDNARNIDSSDICDKVFKSDNFISNVGMNVSRSTILKCNGTYKSGTTYSQITEGELGGNDAELTGRWEVTKEIPDDVKRAVEEFGLKDDNYSIIKYSSSNGINGYCLYHKVEQYYSLTPLYLGQIPMNQYENSASLGIWEGFQ